ncbi:hypothetical protein ACIHCM_30985 [Streptomyces sp. NPDC052023]|uniref:hypothetical protein n=1 Tax=Streptomyces sp. NPDC052023 TaxID=3365681 RepID=UPI0037CD28CE
MKRRTLPTATLAAVAAATLLLTACGSEDDKSTANDRNAGADQGAQEPTASTKAPAAPPNDEPDGVDVSLPKDINLVFDWNKPTDKNDAAAMDDAANFLRGIYRGVDQRTTKDAAVTTYATGDGLHYAETQIDAWIKGGWTATGTLRHYDATTRSAMNGRSVEVAFCADSGKFFGKEIKTNKVLKTNPSIEDFDYYKIVMVKFPTGTDLWQASKVFVETKAAKCK